MEKINLLISSYNLNYGGIEKSLLNLINNLDFSLFHVTLVLERKEGIYLDKISKDIKILEYKPSKSKFINIFKRIKWLIRNRNKYDVSICYATYSLPANFAARTGSKKKILYIHSDYYELYKRDVNKTKEFFDIRYLDEYQKIVFVSNESKNNLINIYKEITDKSIVINNNVDINEIIEKSKEECNINLCNKNIGIFVGRLDEDSKRLSILLNLAKKCQDNKKDIGFLIIGDGKDRNLVEDFIDKEKLNNVKLLGSQDNPYKYIRKSNFLILCSRYEGYPVVYSEAIVLNKPILTTLDITDDKISINNNFGIVSSPEELYDNLDRILKFENRHIDFDQINKERIKKVQELIIELSK
jgi:glycosyltransferase involved in cell wall biosynthesis